MTTIAYKDGVIACDSRASGNDMILDDDFNKRTVRNGVEFYLAGSPSDAQSMMTAYFDGTGVPELDSCAIVIDGDNLFYVMIDKTGKLNKISLRKNQTIAIGSGSVHAYTAMDLGFSAVEAVRAAKKRDMWTGGRVRQYKLNKKQQ